MKENPVRFSVLDSLRGLSAVIIILFHIENIGAIQAGHLHGNNIINHSLVLVDFFFVLSGFVISYTYFSRIETGGDLRQFMVRRFGRIYPMHLFMLIAFLLLELLKLYMVTHGGLNHRVENAPFTKSYSPYSFVTSLLFLQAFNLHGMGVWNSPSWSVAVEFYTYIVFALLVLAVRNNTRAMLAVTMAMVAVNFIILTFWAPHYLNTIHDFAIFRCLYGFFCGVLAQFAYRHISASFAPGTVRDTMAELLVVALAALYMYYLDMEATTLAAPLVFTAFVLVFTRQGGAISRFLMHGPFQRLGHASYTIYITHAFVILLCAKVLRVLMDKGKMGIFLIDAVDVQGQNVSLLTTGSVWAQDGLVVLVLLVVLAVSYVLRRLVEEPCRKYFYRVSAKR